MSRWHADRADKLSKRWERTPEGYLVFRGVRLTRCGVLPYADAARPGGVRREYRPHEEVMQPNSLATLEGKPLVWSHPKVWGEDGQLHDVEITAENHAQYSVGHTQNVRAHADGWPRGDIYVTHAGAVSAIIALSEAGTPVELSPGYWSDDDQTPGTTQLGEAYDLIQRNIRYNHIAVVEEGRAGSAARLVLDAADFAKKDEAMNLEELKAALEKALEEKKAADTQVAELQKQLEAVVGELDALRAGADVEEAAPEVEITGDMEDEMIIDEDDALGAPAVPSAPKAMNLDAADFRRASAHFAAVAAAATHYKIDNIDKLPLKDLHRKICTKYFGAKFKADQSDGYYERAAAQIAAKLASADASRAGLAEAMTQGRKRDRADVPSHESALKLRQERLKKP